MIDLVRLGAFLAFVALGLVVGLARGLAGRRRAVNLLLAYVLVVSGLVAFLQHNAWPFSRHMVAVGNARLGLDTPICLIEFHGVDRTGRDWMIDSIAWSPISDWTLQLWVMRYLGRLAPPQRAHVLAFLLARAEEARQRQSAGERVGNERLLGPLSAPYWWLLPRATTRPDSPYVGIRLYEACHVPRDILRGAPRVRRTLVAEYTG